MCSDVDVIIYWVDGSDPSWLEQYEKYKGTPPNRFRDLGVLKFVFRGIHECMPWVRKIHFITNGQLPDWLDLSYSKVVHHTHEDIFLYKDALPVFNSSSIEANFSNIPDLSEKFILFNDDTLVLKYLPEERFFKDGLPVDYLKLSYPRSGWLYNKIKPQNALACGFINNAYNYIPNKNINKLIRSNLFNKRYSLKTKLSNFIFSFFKKIQWIEIYHQPQPHLKSTWVDFFENNKSVIESTSYSKFRSSSDINQYVYRFLNLINGRFYPVEFNDHESIYVNDVDKFTSDFSFDNKSLLCICEDDRLSDNEFERLKLYLNESLLLILNRKSPYEK